MQRSEIPNDHPAKRALDEWRARPRSEDEWDELAERLRGIEPQVRASLKDARESMGWSQTKLAQELQRIGVRIDPTAITRLESGKRAIRIEEAWALAAVMRLSIEDLLPDMRTAPEVEERLERARRHLDYLDEQRASLDAARSGAVSDIRRLEERLEKEQS